MKVLRTRLPGVIVLEPAVFTDHRGYLMEVWHRERHAGAGLPREFLQDNVSFARRGVVRGLHYQHPAGQGKLVIVLRGEIFDVAVDLRRGSPTFGEWIGETLSAGNGRQLFVPSGLAHGFAVTGEEALVLYKCTDLYHPESEGGVSWNDPDLGIEWPLDNPVLSERDQRLPRLRQLPEERLPRYEEGAMR